MNGSLSSFVCLLVSLTLLTRAGLAECKQHKLWPHPQVIEISEPFYLVNSSTFVLVPSDQCDVITQAIERYRERMFVQDCSRIDPDQRGQVFSSEWHASTHGNSGTLHRLNIRLTGGCEHYPQMDMNERYEITVNDNSAEIVAPSVWGILRGLDTFSQLVEIAGPNLFVVNKVHVLDFPRFAHRQLMIDSSRHFLSVKSIKKTLDAMELNKLNVLHWHLVDDQAFPFESVTYPELSRKGAYVPQTHVYRPQDVQSILEYARVRGIRVLPEFDTPGHTRSWGKAMPMLLTDCYSKNGQPNGQKGPIDPLRNETYQFLNAFFHEIADRFPDKYVHLGGDEVDTACWASNPRIQAFMSEKSVSVSHIESYYIEQLVNIVKRLGRSYIVWQEVFDTGVHIAPDTVVHVWIAVRNGGWRNETSKVTKAGFRTLLSAPWYLEEIRTESWREYYETDPLDWDGTSEQKSRVLGGGACMWGEYADGANLINKVWLTTSALAEKLWSPISLKKASEAEFRLYRVQCRMQTLGIAVGPPQGPSYCQCDHVVS